MKLYKRPILLLPAFLILLMAEPAVSSAEEYRIGSGDVLSISVFEEEDLSLKEARVSGAGTIAYPLIGEIKVKGMTSGELEAHLVRLLQDGYLVKPKVAVSILHYRMFYVHGQVKKPGGYPYIEGLTVQQAVALAGGFTERASENKISLVQEGKSREKPEEVKLGSPVNPGDVIIVGESIF